MGRDWGDGGGDDGRRVGAARPQTLARRAVRGRRQGHCQHHRTRVKATLERISMGTFHYDKDADGIVTVTMDMSGPVNAMNGEYREAMGATVECLEKEPGIIGVVITSAKSTFFAGGDLHELLAIEPGGEAKFMDNLEATKLQRRRLEKL